MAFLIHGDQIGTELGPNWAIQDNKLGPLAGKTVKYGIFTFKKNNFTQGFLLSPENNRIYWSPLKNVKCKIPCKPA